MSRHSIYYSLYLQFKKVITAYKYSTYSTYNSNLLFVFINDLLFKPRDLSLTGFELQEHYGKH